MDGVNYVIVSGFGWSGSSALVDLLKEFEGYYNADIEFRVIKDPYGIDDLYHNLVEQWDILNSDMAIRDFLWHMKHLYHKSTTFSLEIGLDYSGFFGNNFMLSTEKYINDLVDFEYLSNWWFLDFKKNKQQVFEKKVKRKLCGTDGSEKEKMYFSKPSKEKFIELTNEYINNLFTPVVNEFNKNTIILDQGIAIQKYNIESMFFSNAKYFIVDRDPRDIYSDLIQCNVLIGKELSKSRDVNMYLQWHFAMRDGVKNILNNENICFIQFEDLVLNYENTLRKIYTFLGCDESIHVDKNKYFVPEVSAKNIGIWKKLLSSEELERFSILKDKFYSAQ